MARNEIKGNINKEFGWKQATEIIVLAGADTFEVIYIDSVINAVT